MDWVDRSQNIKGLYGILQGVHLANFLLKTLKLDWVAFHSTFNLMNIRNSSWFSHVFCNGLLASFAVV